MHSADQTLIFFDETSPSLQKVSVIDNQDLNPPLASTEFWDDFVPTTEAIYWRDVIEFDSFNPDLAQVGRLCCCCCYAVVLPPALLLCAF